MKSSGGSSVESGKKYDIVLGTSFFPEEEQRDSKYFRLRYGFRPDQGQCFGEGAVISYEKNGVNIFMQRNTGETTTVDAYDGEVASAKDRECILIFEGDHFRLERVTADIKASKIDMDASKACD
uniref:Transcription elongation factor Eaf N-terminal domain-containing protein n=1 Tax=Palpitomonas bilix TaxID=652834 RepID=A0A7S3DG56_9EUKA|mmetsp:Transcript_34092/g.87932  ORF Transcript_34092/g.87932 Transcript_34092/m.87932 type:complete len:124 (+) Transcript_34092:274-645(+)